MPSKMAGFVICVLHFSSTNMQKRDRANKRTQDCAKKIRRDKKNCISYRTFPLKECRKIKKKKENENIRYFLRRDNAEIKDSYCARKHQAYSC